MAKSTSSSNLFAGFNPPSANKKVEKKVEKPKVTVTEQPKEIKKEVVKEDINALVQAEVKKIIESQDKEIKALKIGRPKKYNNPKVVSIKLDEDVYKFVHKKGKADEFNGTTDYINHLIRKDMEK